MSEAYPDVLDRCPINSDLLMTAGDEDLELKKLHSVYSSLLGSSSSAVGQVHEVLRKSREYLQREVNSPGVNCPVRRRREQQFSGFVIETVNRDLVRCLLRFKPFGEIYQEDKVLKKNKREEEEEEEKKKMKIANGEGEDGDVRGKIGELKEKIKDIEDKIEEQKNRVDAVRGRIEVEGAIIPQCKYTDFGELRDWFEYLAVVVACSIALGKIPARHEKRLPGFIRRFVDTVRSAPPGRTDAKVKVNRFLEDVIESSRANAINGIVNVNRQDLLWRFVNRADKAPENVEVSEVREVIKVLLVAMTVTFSAALSWFFRSMAIYTNHQNKVFWEVVQMDHWKNQSLIDNNLGFLEACVSEAIRLGSSNADINNLRKRAKDDKCERQIEKDKKLDDPWVRAEKTMQETVDGFLPGRWVDGLGCFVGLNVNDESPTPFGKVKCCPMKMMVYVVVKCVAIAVLSKFKIKERNEEAKEPSSSRDDESSQGIVVEKVNVEKRKAKREKERLEREKERLEKELMKEGEKQMEKVMEMKHTSKDDVVKDDNGYEGE